MTPQKSVEFWKKIKAEIAESKACADKGAYDLTRPVPCRKFIHNTLAQQVKHIGQEVDELWEALAENITAEIGFIDPDEAADYGRLAEETIDIITACHTLLYMLDMSEVEIEAIQAMVNIKNRDRGYWEWEKPK